MVLTKEAQFGRSRRLFCVILCTLRDIARWREVAPILLLLYLDSVCDRTNLNRTVVMAIG